MLTKKYKHIRTFQIAKTGKNEILQKYINMPTKNKGQLFTAKKNIFELFELVNI